LQQANSNNSHPGISQIAKGAGIIFLGSIVGRLFFFLYLIMLARNLGKELLGLYVLGTTVMQLITIVSALGLNKGVVRYVAMFNGVKDKERTKGAIISALGITTLTSILVAVLLFFFSETIATKAFQKPQLTPILKLFSISLPFSALTLVLLGAIRGFKAMKYQAYVQAFVAPISRILTAGLLFLIGWKLIGASYAYLISTISGAALAFYYLTRLLPVFSKGLKQIFETRNLLKFSSPLLLAGLLYQTMLRIDIMMIGILEKGAAAIGVYSAAVRLAMLGTLVLMAFNSIFAPIISDLHNRRELKQLENLFKITTKWIFSLSFPLYLLMMLFAKPILTIFGADFSEGAISLIILSFGQIINSAVGNTGLMITMSGKPNITLANSLGACILNIVLNLILIPKYGIIGAAIATSTSFAIINVAMLVEAYLLMKVHPYKLTYLKPLLAGIISTIGTVLIASTVQINITSGKLLLLLILFLGTYIALLFLFKLDEEDVTVLKKVKRRFITGKLKR